MAISKHRGKWRIEIWKQSKRVYQKSGYKTKREAMIAEEEIKESLDKMNSDFTKLCSSRLRELKKRRTPDWFYENDLLIKKLIVLWGKKPEVKREDIEDFLNAAVDRIDKENEVAEKKGKKKKSYHYVNLYIRMIKALFQHGVDREWIRVNPASKISPYPIKKIKKYIPPLEDIKKILDKAEPIDRLYLLVIAHTLGRVSSVNSLKWTDIHDGYLSLYTRKEKNSNLKEVKIPLNRVLKEVIEQIPENGSKYLFLNPQTEKPYVYRKLMMRGLCKRAEVKFFNFHALRHYGASKLDSAGVPLATIQVLLGHSRATTTDMYLQSLRGSTQEAVKELEDIE